MPKGIKPQHTKAGIEKLRQAALKQWRNRKHRQHMAALNADPKWRARRSRALKLAMTDERKAKLSELQTKRMAGNSELKRNAVKATRDRWENNLEYRRKMEKLANDPKLKAKRLEAMAKNNPNNLKYGGLDKTALSHFQGCHGRVNIKKVPSIQWPRTREGYIAFSKELGPKPQDGQKWSVGRIDHDLGYEEGNIFWQLYSDNVREMRQRVGGTNYGKTNHL